VELHECCCEVRIELRVRYPLFLAVYEISTSALMSIVTRDDVAAEAERRSATGHLKQMAGFPSEIAAAGHATTENVVTLLVSLAVSVWTALVSLRRLRWSIGMLLVATILK